jgi:hypothetical protein
MFICINAIKIANTKTIFFAITHNTSHHLTSVIFIVFFTNAETVFAKFNQIKIINNAITNFGKNSINELKNSATCFNHIKFVHAKKKTRKVYHFKKSAEIFIGDDFIQAFSKNLSNSIFSKILFNLTF